MTSYRLLKAGLCIAVAAALAQSCTKADAPGEKAAKDPMAVSSEGLKVAILPDEPTAAHALKAVIQGATGEVNYRWELNGRAVDASADTLARGAFRKGDVVRVVAFGGGSEGAASVRIANSRPSVRAVEIRPGETRAGIPVEAFADGADIDGDALRYEYRWSVNGERVFGEGSGVLPGGAFRRGDAISLTVVASDGSEESEPFEVKARTVANSPPLFTSLPPGGFNKDFIYQPRASDPDGDAVSYTLIKGPEGMAVNGGMVEWDASGRSGEVEVVLSAEDGNGGSALQSFLLTVAGK